MIGIIILIITFLTPPFPTYESSDICSNIMWVEIVGQKFTYTLAHIEKSYISKTRNTIYYHTIRCIKITSSSALLNTQELKTSRRLHNPCFANGNSCANKQNLHNTALSWHHYRLTYRRGICWRKFCCAGRKFDMVVI
jgi:hypothetical protein